MENPRHSGQRGLAHIDLKQVRGHVSLTIRRSSPCLRHLEYLVVTDATEPDSEHADAVQHTIRVRTRPYRIRTFNHTPVRVLTLLGIGNRFRTLRSQRNFMFLPQFAALVDLEAGHLFATGPYYQRITTKLQIRLREGACSHLMITASLLLVGTWMEEAGSPEPTPQPSFLWHSTRFACTRIQCLALVGAFPHN